MWILEDFIDVINACLSLDLDGDDHILVSWADVSEKASLVGAS